MNQFNTSQEGINELVIAGESELVEFKSRLPPDGAVAALLAAFANVSGGILILGVNDDGELVGLKKEEAIEASHRLKGIGF